MQCSIEAQYQLGWMIIIPFMVYLWIQASPFALCWRVLVVEAIGCMLNTFSNQTAPKKFVDPLPINGRVSQEREAHLCSDQSSNLQIAVRLEIFVRIACSTRAVLFKLLVH